MSEHREMKPRLLLVEDDAISCSFMAAALEALPAKVDTAASMAIALASEGAHDLWLLDVNLPDGSGLELLATLRARCHATPALAHTADDSSALREQLLAAGFSGVLVKPLTAAQLQQAVRRQLGPGPAPAMRVAEAATLFPSLPLWDRATALAALNGKQEHVLALRKLFLDELGRQHGDIVSALHAGQHAAASRTLHQLKASSGFVGALRLNAAARALENLLEDAATLEAFSACVAQTRSAEAEPKDPQ